MKSYIFIFYFAWVFSSHAYGLTHPFPDTDFRKADSIATLYPKHSLYDIRALASKLTLPLSTEEEKFRAIYKWVCNNIDYDYPVHQQNQQKREKLKDSGEREAWNKKISNRVFKVLLEKQRTVCTGYAYLVKELAYHAGINCIVIDGYGRTAQSNIRGSGSLNHSWNAVQLHGQWYLCDPTWSSGAYDTQLSQYIRKYNDVYFLADPSLFVRNHYPLDTTWILSEQKSTLREFVNGPLIYVDAFIYRINALYPETFDVAAEKGKKISFRFRNNSDKSIGKVELAIKPPGDVKIIKPQFEVDSTGLYTLNHVFMSRGTYAVHILLDGNYIVTYEVTVK